MSRDFAETNEALRNEIDTRNKGEYLILSFSSFYKTHVMSLRVFN